MPGMRDDREVRTVAGSELRVIDGEDGPVIEGYGAVFNAWSEDLGGFVELVRNGAFRATLADGADVRALWQHDPSMVLGRTRSGTLELEEDERGLRYRAHPPDTQWARDAIASIRRGDVDQSSFRFETVRDAWSEQEGSSTWRRELIEVRLYDVSPVTFPAYPQTSAQVRARLGEVQGDPPEDEGQEPPDAGAEDEADSARARLALERRRVDLMEYE